MYKKTKVELITEALDLLKVGESIDKKALVKKHWGSISLGYDDYFVIRSFDVAYFWAKNSLPGKKFKTRLGRIERVDFSDASLLMTAESVTLMDGTVLEDEK